MKKETFTIEGNTCRTLKAYSKDGTTLGGLQTAVTVFLTVGKVLRQYGSDAQIAIVDTETKEVKCTISNEGIEHIANPINTWAKIIASDTHKAYLEMSEKKKGWLKKVYENTKRLFRR